MRSIPFTLTIEGGLAVIQEERRRYPALAAIDRMLDEAATLVQATRRLNTAATCDVRRDMLIRSERLLARASYRILNFGTRTPEARALLSTRVYFLRMVDEHLFSLAKAHARYHLASCPRSSKAPAY